MFGFYRGLDQLVPEAAVKVARALSLSRALAVRSADVVMLAGLDSVRGVQEDRGSVPRVHYARPERQGVHLGAGANAVRRRGWIRRVRCRGAAVRTRQDPAC